MKGCPFICVADKECHTSPVLVSAVEEVCPHATEIHILLPEHGCGCKVDCTHTHTHTHTHQLHSHMPLPTDIGLHT